MNVSTGLTMLIGAVALAPAMIGDTGNIAEPRTLALIAWLGLITTGAVYALYTKGLQSVSANLAGTLSLGEPLAATLLSTLVLGERLSVIAWTACAVVLVGLLTAAMTGPETSQQYVWPKAIGMVAMPVGIPVRPGQVGLRPPVVGRARLPQHPIRQQHELSLVA